MEVDRSESCCIIGQTSLPENYEGILLNAMEIMRSLFSKEVKHFYIGGAPGFDLAVSESLIYLKQQYPEIKIHSIVPYPDWLSNWSTENKNRQEQILKNSDSIFYVNKCYYRGILNKRDKILVDNTSHCITFCNKAVGETAKTIGYAIAQNLAVYNTCSWDLNRLTRE